MGNYPTSLQYGGKIQMSKNVVPMNILRPRFGEEPTAAFRRNEQFAIEKRTPEAFPSSAYAFQVLSDLPPWEVGGSISHAASA